MPTKPPIYCCVPIEFIQPWDQAECLRQVAAHKLGNMVLISGTCHVANSDEERTRWKREFPYLAQQIDATPKFDARPDHGMCIIVNLLPEFWLSHLELCRELGLQVFHWPAHRDLEPNQKTKLESFGEGMIFSEMFMGESLSILHNTIPAARLKQIDATPILLPLLGEMQSHKPAGAAGSEPAKPSIFDEPGKLDFAAVHDWLIRRFSAHAARLRAISPAPLSAIEASPQIRYALEAGADLPIFELVPSKPLPGLAATRGAAKAYDKPIWGIHAAMGYYRAPTDLRTPERLRIAYDLFYAGGASFFSEPNIGLRNWGSCSAFFSINASPPIRWAEKECREFNDPLCVRGREVLAEHYRFTQFHDRPYGTSGGGPRVPMGYLLGHLDAWSGDCEADTMWMVDHPGFRAADALKTWRHFERAFDSESWYVAPKKYYWQADAARPLALGTPPCGQVDLVPLEASTDKLASYRCLAMLGWNTMTDANYTKLLAFVREGGTLFLSVPHLSTRTRADQPAAFIRHGDVSELCGVRILGEGEKIDEAYLANASQSRRHEFAQGVLYLEEATTAKLELRGATTLAHPRKRPDLPVLLENRVGYGMVYLLNSWDYPGERLDALITDVLRTLAEAEQGEIKVEGRDVFYAVYDFHPPSGGQGAVVYLVNHDVYGQPAYPRLLAGQRNVPLRVDGREMRIAWVFDGLLVSPFDKFVKVTDASRDAEGWTVTLEAAPQQADGATTGERLIQIHSSGRDAIAADGVALTIETTREGERIIRWRGGEHATLKVRAAK